MARYIELDKAIEQFCSYGSVFTYGDNVCKAIVSRLKQVPTADVRENVHAHWEEWSYLGFDVYRHWFRRCSNCFWEREDDNEEKDTPFCPNCGAVMDERREET